ncbi:phosphatase PAP2 family protein [Saccharicrinis fermentans]|uniref:PAP2 superfamily protein n=1 Tax=Saccharicrinis fermentans DSM 9555 = JCM 21142 TaxID=869213 RepID=W7XVM5_9BACT|nr:phosphatase PAP2 family protein [Saccharicrinis fermentans]GAF02205.1 PAP2 superfamily protein [Saccharicrinis fermentans DSM 9555 = JCM 21142]
MKSIFAAVLIACVVSINVTSQNSDNNSNSVYRVNKYVEIPAIGGLFVASFYGFRYLSDKGGLTQNELSSLNTKDIWWFDRWAAEQDAAKRNDFHHTSDMLLNGALALPVILGLDKGIRNDWLDILVMYVELHGINNTVYVSGASSFYRKRPFVYSDDVPLDERMAKETENSFFSGHASTSAAAAFFAATVYSDYHPELGNKKYWLYGAALVPPACGVL